MKQDAYRRRRAFGQYSGMHLIVGVMLCALTVLSMRASHGRWWLWLPILLLALIYTLAHGSIVFASLWDELRDLLAKRRREKEP